jgi:hypothetical protein
MFSVFLSQAPAREFFVVVFFWLRFFPTIDDTSGFARVH